MHTSHGTGALCNYVYNKIIDICILNYSAIVQERDMLSQSFTYTAINTDIHLHTHTHRQALFYLFKSSCTDTNIEVEYVRIHSQFYILINTESVLVIFKFNLIL